jgi:hypothetical protein
VCRCDRGLSGCPQRRDAPVSGSVAPSAPTVCQLVRAGAIPSCLVSPSESLRRSSSSPWGDTSCRGSRPSSRHHRAASTRRESTPAPATFRPQAFSASRRFPPPLGFAGLFHPAATSRVSVQGFLPLRSPPRLVAGRFLHAVVVPSLTGAACAGSVATTVRLGFEALLHGAMRFASEAFNQTSAVAPLFGFVPPGPRGLFRPSGFPRRGLFAAGEPFPDRQTVPT